MGRVVVLAMLVFVAQTAISGQTLVVLHIRAALTDATGQATPLARHALLISDNPPTREPRRVVTSVDGTADVRLRPGNYIVESDQPVAFQGKAYHWTQTLDVVAGRDSALELTAANAVAEPIAPGTTNAASALATDPSLLLRQWLDSVVELWTPTAHASGFLVDAAGLIVDEPEGRWRRDVGRSAALALDQSGGDRRRSRSAARHRRRPNRPNGHGVDQARAAWMLARQPTADRARAGDLRACCSAPSAEGMGVWNGEPRRRACHRVRPHARHRRRRRAGVHRLRRSRGNHCAPGRA